MFRKLMSAIMGVSLAASPVLAQTPTLAHNAPPLAEALGEPVAKTWAVWQDQQTRALAKVPRNAVIKPEDWIVPIDIGPGTARPDVVGAWRVNLKPLDYGYNDAVLYPNIKNGSPHGHVNYGVKGIDEKTTSESLLAYWKGGYNPLLGSAYWTPWLVRLKDMKVIQPDVIFVYYKRLPINDPECTRTALKGCIPTPKGLKMIVGYDMKRMGQPQPENQEFSYRCATPGKDGSGKPLLADAIAACGGEGQIIAAIGFPTCSDGRVDSPDHRSHLAKESTGWWGYPKCPDTHPYLMPAITQQVEYTIKADDGPVAFSSDVTPGMPRMPGGSSFHADYIFGLHPYLVEGMERCFNQLLSCSNGVMGNKTMLKEPERVEYPRIIDAPAR